MKRRHVPAYLARAYVAVMNLNLFVSLCAISAASRVTMEVAAHLAERLGWSLYTYCDFVCLAHLSRACFDSVSID